MVKTRSQKASDETEDAAPLVGTSTVPPPGPNAGPSCSSLVKQSARRTRTATQSAASIHENGMATDMQEQPRTKRMKWSEAMNKCIIRSYYKCTCLETDSTDYRRKMHQLFINEFPEINVTEQRVADQKRVIVRNKLLADPIIERLKADVRRELEMEEETDEAAPTEAHDHNSIVCQAQGQHTDDGQRGRNGNGVDIDEIENSIDEMHNRARYEYHRAEAEFMNHPPAERPRIPRIKETMQVKKYISAINEYLQDMEYEEGMDGLNGRLYCAAVAIIRMVGFEVIQDNKTQRKMQPSKPEWQMRIEKEITELRAELNRITVFKPENASRRSKNKIQRLKKKYETHSRHERENAALNEVRDTIKQKLIAKAAKLKSYKKSYTRRTDNQKFQRNEKQFYRNINPLVVSEGDGPTKEQVTEYWSSIWSKEVKYKADAEWINALRSQDNDIEEMAQAEITKEELDAVLKRAHNWKAPGPDKVQNFWIKKVTAIHGPLLRELNRCLQDPALMTDTLTRGVTYLLPKKGDSKDPSKYRPITCLPTTYKIFTACIAAKIQKHCENNCILAEEQKGCRKGMYGCKEQLIIDQLILEQARKTQRKISTAYIDYQKAFDSVPHDWLIKCLQIYKIHPAIVACLETIMQKWSTIIQVRTSTATYQTPSICIRRGIFQGDSLSSLWFCLALNPMSTLLNKSPTGFNIRDSRRNLYNMSHLLYMDDVKLYATNRQKLTQLLEIVRMFSEDIKMQFGLDKCRILDLKDDGTPNIDNPEEWNTVNDIREMEPSETYRYLGIEQNRRTEHQVMKDEIVNKFTTRMKQILNTGLNSKNIVKAINVYAIPVVTYSFGIISWSSTELESLERKVRVLLTKNRMLHPKSAIERQTLPRKRGGRGIVSLKLQHQKQCDNLRRYFHRRKDNSDLHRAVVRADRGLTVLKLNTEIQRERPNRSLEEEQQITQWRGKVLHGRYPAELQKEGVNHKASVLWLTDGFLYPETEGFYMAIQDEVINTRNYCKYIIKDATIQDDRCRKCGKAPETIQHIIGSCSNLVAEEYKSRHDSVAKIMHSALVKKFCPREKIEPYYKYEPPKALENKEMMIYWDRTIYTYKSLAHNRPDITLKDKLQKTVYIIDIAVPNVNNLMSTVQHKRSKYTELANEIGRQWKMKTKILPIVISTTGIIPQATVDSVLELGGSTRELRLMQKAVILHTVNTVRRVIGE